MMSLFNVISTRYLNECPLFTLSLPHFFLSPLSFLLSLFLFLWQSHFLAQAGLEPISVDAKTQASYLKQN